MPPRFLRGTVEGPPSPKSLKLASISPVCSRQQLLICSGRSQRPASFITCCTSACMATFFIPNGYVSVHKVFSLSRFHDHRADVSLSDSESDGRSALYCVGSLLQQARQWAARFGKLVGLKTCTHAQNASSVWQDGRPSLARAALGSCKWAWPGCTVRWMISRSRRMAPLTHPPNLSSLFRSVGWPIASC